MSVQHGTHRPRKQDTEDMLYIYIYIYILLKETKYRHKDPIFLENKTFVKHLECLQISILPFICTKKDCKSSFNPAESEKITMKNVFWSQIGRTWLGHVSNKCLARVLCSGNVPIMCQTRVLAYPCPTCGIQTRRPWGPCPVTEVHNYYMH
jgi:hypothetical protein